MQENRYPYYEALRNGTLLLKVEGTNLVRDVTGAQGLKSGLGLEIWSFLDGGVALYEVMDGTNIAGGRVALPLFECIPYGITIDWIPPCGLDH